MAKRKIHAHVFGDQWTFCGILRRGKIVSVQVHGGSFLREESGVTCGNCWKAAA
jgi:hypothetical protein